MCEEFKKNNKWLFDFYNDNYVILCCHFFNQNDYTRLGNDKQKICRFCGRKEPEVSFNQFPHVIPELVGNKYLGSYYECNKCNKFFGQYLEAEYANCFNFQHNLFKVHGKRGVPIYESKGIKAKWKRNGEKEYFVICVQQDENNRFDKGEMIIDANTSPSFMPIAVFKCIVKMAISLLPEGISEYYKETIEWILDKKHKNFYQNKQLLVRAKIIPGYNVVKFPCAIIYKRKKHSYCLPDLIFHLTYEGITYIIEVPDNNSLACCNIRNVPFPIVPYVTGGENIINLSSCCKQKRQQQITFQYNERYECTEELRNSGFNPKNF